MIIRGNTITVQKPSLALKGGTMTGTLDMNENILKGIPTPTEKDHAVNKEYADFINQKAEEANTAAAKALKDAKKYPGLVHHHGIGFHSGKCRASGRESPCMAHQDSGRVPEGCGSGRG